MSGNLKFGLIAAETGPLTVLALFGLLILFVCGFAYLSNRKKNTTTDKTAEIDAKIIAAITACISHFYFTENIDKTEDIQPDFIVKNIKRR